jgi:two-component system cell cycle sensor histidine kinase/response regulator CckA
MRKIVDLRTVRSMIEIERLRRKSRGGRIRRSDPEKSGRDSLGVSELLFAARFLKGISRDFNNLLTCIQGNVSLMLLDMDSGHPDYKYLKDLEKCVKKGAALTRRLSSTGDAIKPTKESVKVNHLIRMYFHNFGKEKEQFSCHQRYQDGIWAVEADQEDIERIIKIIYNDVARGISAGGDTYIRTQNVILSETYVRPHGLAPGRFVKISITYTNSGEGKERIGISERETVGIFHLIKRTGGIVRAYKDEENKKTMELYLPARKKAFDSQNAPKI